MYRSQKNYENLQRMIFDGVGEYQIPQIKPTTYKESEFIPFNYAKTCKDKNGKGVHFFIDDYQCKLNGQKKSGKRCVKA